MAENKYLEKIASMADVPEKLFPYAIGAAIGGATGTVIGSKDNKDGNHITGALLGGLAGGALGHAGAGIARLKASRGMVKNPDFSASNIGRIRQQVAKYTGAGAATGGVGGGIAASQLMETKNNRYERKRHGK